MLAQSLPTENMGPFTQEIEIHPDKTTSLIFQFLYQPEYIGVGNNLVINMDTLKAFGKITQLFPEKIDDSRPIQSNEPQQKLKEIQSGIMPIPESQEQQYI